MEVQGLKWESTQEAVGEVGLRETVTGTRRADMEAKDGV